MIVITFRSNQSFRVVTYWHSILWLAEEGGSGEGERGRTEKRFSISVGRLIDYNDALTMGSECFIALTTRSDGAMLGICLTRGLHCSCVDLLRVYVVGEKWSVSG